MKKMIILIGCIATFTAMADDKYTPPTKLNTSETKVAEDALVKNKITLLNHWKTRLEKAKLNNTRLIKSGVPLQRPYYGDTTAHNHQ